MCEPMRNGSSFSLSVVLVASLASVAACYLDGAGASGEDPSVADRDGAALEDAAIHGDSAPLATTGVPCNVETILETHCWACHGESPVGPSRLVTYADLTAPSVTDKTKSEAEEALARMESTTSPMPPSGPKPTTTEIATFKAWVTAGTPKGAACGADAGVKTPTAPDAGNPYATPLVCTSKKYWNGTYDSTMHPGRACNDCHGWTIAGTVYPTAHEPNDCDGVPGKATVVITDAHGKTASLAANSAGNFLYSSSLTPPYSVKVVYGTKTRVMSTKAPSGNCNHCHTASGAYGAPGRIMEP
jgi:hypothetical protein